ncbi:hypothetical protein [Spongiactinospora rosea]|uniref:hypothetical protein n=1 Tax=Spongiactinospora rosea TaxID=2248750 RepID=UPI0011C05EDF|nr:hypothetical protein [Spongiactinospora rosea]
MTDLPRIAVRLAAALLVPLLTSACLMMPDLHVAPGVIKDMESIGVVLQKKTLNAAFGDYYNTVIQSRTIAVDASDSVRSFSKVVAFLKSRGWHVIKHEPYDYLRLESDKWKNTEITIYSIEFMERSTSSLSEDGKAWKKHAGGPAPGR